MTALEVILSILLFILKAIGIVILTVLILVILTLLSVLFVPVRYRAEGRIIINDEKEGQKPVSGEVKATVSWMLHIISIRVWTSENKLYYYGKLFGKRIVDSETPRSKKEKKKRNNKKKEEASISEAHKSEKSAEKALADIDKSLGENVQNSDNNTDKAVDKTFHEKEKTYTEADNEKKEKDSDCNNKEYTDSKEKESLIDKLKNVYNIIYTKIEKIKFKFIEICDKIKNVNGTREEFTAFLTTEESRSAITEIKCRIIKILLHIKPLKLTINASYGLKDPALTGQVYGVLCILLSRYGDKININPQFTDVSKPFVAGDFKCNGRIRAAVLLIHAIKIYKIKRLKEFIAFAKGKGKRNGR